VSAHERRIGKSGLNWWNQAVKYEQGITDARWSGGWSWNHVFVRPCVRTVAEQRDTKETTVADAIRPHMTYCFEDEDVRRAAMLMVEQQMRRLVVFDHEKQLAVSCPWGILPVRRTILG